jgi:hypothetical protein
MDFGKTLTNFVWSHRFANSTVRIMTLIVITYSHWPICSMPFVRLPVSYWLWRRVIPYKHNFDWERTAGVTGQRRMLTPPWHPILPSLCRGSILLYTWLCICCFWIVITLNILLTSPVDICLSQARLTHDEFDSQLRSTQDSGRFFAKRSAFRSENQSLSDMNLYTGVPCHARLWPVKKLSLLKAVTAKHRSKSAAFHRHWWHPNII